MGRKKQVNKGNIEIGTSLSIFDATMIHTKIIEAYKTLDRIEIDLKDITDCDTAGVQILYSLKKACIDTGKTFALVNPSDAVTDALERMSMTFENLTTG
ncbi:MAG: STAS domain-containing protein [Deltaproteobacteria bacterium]|nr:STAS domain-containing protein [Deltaproteobacteria bacterium]